MSLPPLLVDERRRAFGALLGLGLARAAATVAGILLLRRAIDRGLSGAAPTEIGALVALLLLASAMGALVKVGERARAERLGALYAGAVRTRLLEHFLADPGRGGPARLGRLLARLSGELQAIRAWPGRGLPRLLSEGVLLLACAAAAFLLEPRLGLVLAALLLVTAATMAALRPGLLEAVAAARRARGRAAARAARLLASRLAGEAVDGAGVGAIDREEARLARLAARRGRASALLLVLPDLLRGLLVAALVLLAAGLAPGPPVSAGVVAGSLALLAALVPALRELARVIDRHAAWRVARERLEQLLRTPAALPAAADAADQRRQPTD
jgi:ABC-type multidrug transport system fused ATPase/permease subunit